ncbi:MAG: sigma-70 family RNA polymerase sigma factor [Candidatus Hydrogenedentales bacterium]
MVLLKEARSHDDTRLVEACRRGDSTAFDELVRRYKDRVYAVVYRFVGNREDALDISQEVFVHAYRSINGYRGAAQVYTWLYSIAANLARNRLRDAGRRGRNMGTSLEALQEQAPGAAEAGRSSGGNPRDNAMTSEMEAVLQQVLNELPEHYRMAFVLRTFDDLSYEEIAESMGCPVNTVKSRLNMARVKLRDRLKELSLI